MEYSNQYQSTEKAWTDIKEIMISSDSSTTENDFITPSPSGNIPGFSAQTFDEEMNKNINISYDYHDHNIKRNPYMTNIPLEYSSGRAVPTDNNLPGFYNNNLNSGVYDETWTEFSPVDESHLLNNMLLQFPNNQMNMSNQQLSDMGETVNNKLKQNMMQANQLVTPQTRHARRIYVGGISPNHTDEDSLRNFLNSVICKCLGDDPDSTYILSIYVNQQKCFAFVELNSIELTTACLELDGILYLNSPLKILRANEYKPELLPPATYPPFKLNLNGLLFGPTSIHSTSSTNNFANVSNQTNVQQQPVQQMPVQSPVEPQIDSLIKYCSVNTVQRGSIAIVGFPYDDGKKVYGPSLSTSGLSLQQQMGNSTTSKIPRGCAIASRSIRNALRKYHAGSLTNPEYNIDLTNLKIVDVGDIQGNMSLSDAYRSLSDIMCEIIQRGSIPLVIGGPSDLSFHVASGVMMISSQQIGMINICPSLDISVVNDSRFYNLGMNNSASNKLGISNKLNCDGRYVQFAAQGSCSTIDQAKLINERGGKILWVSKDLCLDSSPSLSPSTTLSGSTYNTFSSPLDIGQIFRNSLKSVGSINDANTVSSPHNVTRPICVSMSMNSLSAMHFPGQQQCHSIGLTTNNAIDIALAIGKDPNVVAFCINEFNPDFEETRSSRVIIDIIYYFIVGYAMRNPSANISTSIKTISSKSPQIPVRPSTASVAQVPRNPMPGGTNKFISNPSNTNYFQNNPSMSYGNNDMANIQNNYSNYRPSSAGTFLPSKDIPNSYDMNNFESGMKNLSMNSSYNNIPIPPKMPINRPHSATSPAPSNYNDLINNNNNRGISGYNTQNNNVNNQNQSSQSSYINNNSPFYNNSNN